MHTCMHRDAHTWTHAPMCTHAHRHAPTHMCIACIHTHTLTHPVCTPPHTCTHRHTLHSDVHKCLSRSRACMYTHSHPHMCTQTCALCAHMCIVYTHVHTDTYPTGAHTLTYVCTDMSHMHTPSRVRVRTTLRRTRMHTDTGPMCSHVHACTQGTHAHAPMCLQGAADPSISGRCSDASPRSPWSVRRPFPKPW